MSEPLAPAVLPAAPPAAPPAAALAPTRSDRVACALLALALAVEAALVSGRTHPDEVYQFLEPANHLAFHFGLLTWEWEKGLRNWAVPGALAAGMKLADVLGFTTALGRRLGAALPVALMLAPGLWGAFRYALRRTPGRAWAWGAIALFCTWAVAAMFLGRTMGEPLGTLFLIAALERLDREEADWRSGALAGVWLGLAVVVRYSFAALVLAVVLQELLRRRWRAAGAAVVGGAAVALALGLLDLWTWGHLFHSMSAYLKFNLGEQVVQRFGKEPPAFFLPVVAKWTPWLLLLGMSASIRRDRMLLPALAGLVAIVATPHKEERFFAPVVFLVLAGLTPLAAARAAQAWARGGVARAAVALGLAAYLGHSAWTWDKALPDLETDLFHATMKEGLDPALKDLLIVNESVWGCGGNVMLGKPNHIYYTGPGYPWFHEVMQNRQTNRAILFRGVGKAEVESLGGFHEVGHYGTTLLMER